MDDLGDNATDRYGWDSDESPDGSRTFPSEVAPTEPARPQPSPVMFWLLMAMASATFTPCVIVPVWRDYQAIKLAERFEARAVEQLREHAQHLQRHLDALRRDPAVIERIARRDLSYRRPFEANVPVVPMPVAPVRIAETVDLRIEPPDVVRGFLTWLPISAARADVFVDPTSRRTLMCLSGGLVLAAFVLYPPRRKQHAAFPN